jgi:hypothetical protein
MNFMRDVREPARNRVDLFQRCRPNGPSVRARFRAAHGCSEAAWVAALQSCRPMASTNLKPVRLGLTGWES